MGTITWNTNVKAPCCPGEIINNDTKQSILVQSDYDYPGVASSFGWSTRDVQIMQARYYGVLCDHARTDGTIDCPDCGLAAGSFINAAAVWLRENNGLTVDDPGYFFVK